MRVFEGGATRGGELPPLEEELECCSPLRLRTGDEGEEGGLAFRLAPAPPGMWFEALRSTLGLRSAAGFTSSFFFVAPSCGGDCLGELVLELGEKLAPLPSVGVVVPDRSLALNLASRCARFSSSTFFSRASASGFLL